MKRSEYICLKAVSQVTSVSSEGITKKETRGQVILKLTDISTVVYAYPEGDVITITMSRGDVFDVRNLDISIIDLAKMISDVSGGVEYIIQSQIG